MYAPGEKDMFSISDHMLNFPLLYFIYIDREKERGFRIIPEMCRDKWLMLPILDAWLINVTSDILRENVAYVDCISNNLPKSKTLKLVKYNQLCN